MAYETGSATGIADLISSLVTFATGLTTTPWTADEDAATQATLSRSNCIPSFRWESTDPDMLSVYQSLGWVTTTTPDLYTDDSGNGSATVPATQERRVNMLFPGPYTYHFLAGEGSTPYVHVIVEIEPNRFRFFGFGNLVKNNDWTGGEYVYGGLWDQNASYIDRPADPHHALLLDNTTTANNGATVHMEGMPNQASGGKWGVCVSPGISSVGNDTGGTGRAALFGSARSGLWGRHLGWIPASLSNTYKPMAPIELLYRDATPTPDNYSFLGTMPDVAIVNCKNVNPGGAISDGTDDWLVFPWAIKQYLPLATTTEQSYNGGFAFRKIV